MLARCAHCQKTFETDRFGVQGCPHCGQQVLLADPSAPPPAGTGAAPADAGPGAPPPAPPPAGEGVAGAAPPGPGAPPAGGGWGAPPPGWGAPPPGWGGPPGSAPPAEAEAPWARRATLGNVRAFLDTWKLALLQPAAFFRAVKVSPAGPAILFGVVASTISSWVQALYGALWGAATRETLQRMLDQVPQGGRLGNTWMMNWVAGGSAAGTVGQMIAAPFLALLGVLVWSAVFHVVLLLLKGAPRGFDATLTVVGYASGAYLVAALPVPGIAGVVAFVWFLAAVGIGLQAAQRTTPGKAWAATLLPLGLVCLCCCGGVAALGSAIGGLISGGRTHGLTL
jgi:hypothetical protein